MAMEATTAMATMASALLRRSPRLLLLPTMAMEATTAMATMANALLRLSQLLNTTSPFTDTTGTMASAPLMLSPRQSPRRSPGLLLFPIMAMEATTAMATMASALLRRSRLLNTTPPFMDTTATMASALLMLSLLPSTSMPTPPMDITMVKAYSTP